MEQARASAARLGARLRALVDEDAAAYNTVAAARRLPRETEAEKSERRRAVQDATIRAARTPLETLGALADLALVVERVVSEGNPACVSDAGSAGALVRAGALAAGYNVRINLPSVEDATIRRELSAETEKALKAVSMAAGRIEQILETRLNERSAP
jgi:formiminotetrahydrofolate cyclodeaminase